jgi:hypothetical protein
MIYGSEEERVWLRVELTDFLAVATEALFIELRRCGVGFCEEENGLYVIV